MAAGDPVSAALEKAKATLAKANSDYPSNFAKSAGATPASAYAHVREETKKTNPPPEKSESGVSGAVKDIAEGLKSRKEMTDKALGGPGE